jgi:hypothetical protein
MGRHGRQREYVDTDAVARSFLFYENDGVRTFVLNRLLTWRSLFVSFCALFVPVRAMIYRESDRRFNGIMSQTTCKPGSVQTLRPGMTIHLGRALLRASRDQPGRRDGNVPASAGAVLPAPARRPPLFGLAPGGVCPAAPVAGGAVRSYRTISPLPAHGFPWAGGLFSVALSLGSPPPAVGRHRIPVEPGLSSTGGFSPAAAIRSSGAAEMRARRWGVNSGSGWPL